MFPVNAAVPAEKIASTAPRPAILGRYSLIAEAIFTAVFPTISIRLAMGGSARPTSLARMVTPTSTPLITRWRACDSLRMRSFSAAGALGAVLDHL